ncbi:MAG TPA: two-component system response regulator, partial [Sphingomonas sp.]|nr:two-component system response regulator [Sphingomonas sp.]
MRIAIIDTSTTRAAIISEGLKEAGLDDLVVIDGRGPLVAQIEAANPEVVLINLENPSRDMLEEYFVVSRALARPIAMFVDQSNPEATAAAVDAGVSAYIIDGLSKQRIMPVIDLAVRRFNAFSRLQAELHEAKSALAD